MGGGGTTGFVQSRKIRENESFEESPGKSGKILELFLWSGEVCIFQINLGNFLNFLNF